MVQLWGLSKRCNKQTGRSRYLQPGTACSTWRKRSGRSRRRACNGSTRHGSALCCIQLQQAKTKKQQRTQCIKGLWYLSYTHVSTPRQIGRSGHTRELCRGMIGTLLSPFNLCHFSSLTTLKPVVSGCQLHHSCSHGYSRYIVFPLFIWWCWAWAGSHNAHS